MKLFRALALLTLLVFAPRFIYADNDETLYMLGYDDPQGGFALYELSLPPTVSYSKVLTINHPEGHNLAGIEYVSGTFYITSVYAVVSSPDYGESSLWTLNTSTGDLTLVDEMGAGVVRQLVKNPSDDSVWALYSYLGAPLVAYIAEVNLSTAEVDTANEINLYDAFDNNNSAGGFAAFSAQGKFLTSNSYYAGNLKSFVTLDLESGVYGPDCDPTESFSPCWTLGQNSLLLPKALVANPDTGQLIGLTYADPRTGSGCIEVCLVRYEIVGTVVNEFWLGAVFSNADNGDRIGDLTFAPNVQSDPPPLPPEDQAALIYDMVFGDIPAPTPTPTPDP